MEEDEVGGGAEPRELRARIRELRQKLVMAEQAVNDKEEELRDMRKAMEDLKREAELDLQRERHALDEANRASETKIAELQEKVGDLGGYIGECKEALAQQEAKAEVERLQSMEALREKFDRERDMYLKRIKELEEKRADGTARRDPISSGAEPGREKGSVPSMSGGELEHGVKGIESKESKGVSLSEGGHSEKPSEGLGSAPGTDEVEGTAMVKTTTTELKES